jgi:pimeloyl-ACP methyl ester carboxylesterase
MGHGGGQHEKAPGMVARARRFAGEGGFAVAVVDAPGHGDRPRDTAFNRVAAANRARMEAGEPVSALVADLHRMMAEQSVPEWRRVLDALHGHVGAGPVGYWGVSMGCGLGVPFVAAEPRVRAAVLGLGPVHAAGGAVAGVTGVRTRQRAAVLHPSPGVSEVPEVVVPLDTRKDGVDG